MIFNSKQLEELENAHDSTGAFEEEGSSNNNSDDDSGDAGAMEWRRQLIEEASENVKRSTTRPVDPEITYEIRSLLFDRETRRFGRVTVSVPGYLKIDFLNGGDRELGLLSVPKYLKEFGHQKKLAELSLQLGMTDHEVYSELESLGITPVDADEPAPEAGKTEDKSAAKDGKAAGKAAKKEPPATTKGKAAEKAPATAKSKTAAKKAPAKKTARGKKQSKGNGRGDNPIDDPNSFIKANYMEQSNRELARVTGLSEHTIRRKLGEWSLKRKKK